MRDMNKVTETICKLSNKLKRVKVPHILVVDKGDKNFCIEIGSITIDFMFMLAAVIANYSKANDIDSKRILDSVEKLLSEDVNVHRTSDTESD